MAPLSRTCCGFLKLQLTCKVGTSRVFLRPGLNIGLNHLYGYPVVQVRECLLNRMIIIQVVKSSKITLLRLSLPKETKQLVTLLMCFYLIN